MDGGPLLFKPQPHISLDGRLRTASVVRPCICFGLLVRSRPSGLMCIWLLVLFDALSNDDLMGQ